MRAGLREGAIDLRSFSEGLTRHPPTRVEGTGLFLTADRDGVPHALLHNLLHNKVLHERVLLLTVVIEDVPSVPESRRLHVETLAAGFHRLTIHFGFRDTPDVPAALEGLPAHGLPFEMMETSFFLSRETVVPAMRGAMALWRERLFAAMARNAGSAATCFRLPANRVIELGTQVETRARATRCPPAGHRPAPHASGRDPGRARILSSMSLRKLKTWEAAGLIDTATAARIREWEASNTHPAGLRAVVGIAVLAIGLGLISVVAANWDAIPGLVRLAVHFIALLACSAAARRWPGDALLFVLGVLGLTFFGHLGQVYQTSAPLHVPLGVWLLLFSPLLLLRGEGRLIALLFFVAFWAFGWSYGLHTVSIAERAVSHDPTLVAARLTAAFSLPVLVAGLVAWAQPRSRRVDLWRTLDHLALAYAAALASTAAVASAFIDSKAIGEDTFTAAIVSSLFLLVAALLVRVFARSPHARLQAQVFAGLAAVPPLAWLLSGNQTVAALLFMTLWAGLAAAALRAGWRTAFQQAVALIALRLVILSFELASDLLTSGAGLILAGVLVLAVAWAALRIARRFSPPGSSAPRDAHP